MCKFIIESNVNLRSVSSISKLNKIIGTIETGILDLLLFLLKTGTIINYSVDEVEQKYRDLSAARR